MSHLVTTSSDCEKLTLSNKDDFMDYIDHLNEEMHTVKENLVEVEAKNRLYTLLKERTRYLQFLAKIARLTTTRFLYRQEHQASEQKVRASRELRKNCRDDIGTLSRTYHETCSLKEEADKKFNRLKKMQREVKS